MLAEENGQAKAYTCRFGCGKEYRHSRSLTAHQKKCKYAGDSDPIALALQNTAERHALDALQKEKKTLQQTRRRLAKNVEKLQRDIIRMRQRLCMKQRRLGINRQIGISGAALSKRTLRRKRQRLIEMAVKEFGDATAGEQCFLALVGRYGVAIVRNWMQNERISKMAAIHSRAAEKLVLKRKLKAAENGFLSYVRSVSAAAGPGGLISKRKYIEMCKRARRDNKTSEFCVPNLIPYNRLRRQMRRRTDIQNKVHDIKQIQKQATSEKAEDEVPLRGKWRPIKDIAICLARKCLTIFDGNVPWVSVKNCFNLSVGMDGWPHRKDEAMDFSLSLLEFRARIQSNPNNMITFAGNVKETSTVVLDYCRQMVREIDDLCQVPIDVEYWSRSANESVPVQIQFQVGVISADQKMLAVILGELSNSARQFSPFCKASLGKDSMDLKTVGREIGCGPNDFEPRSFKSRLADFDKLQKSVSVNASHKEVVDACGKLEIRQAMYPPIGRLADYIEICVLHVSLTAFSTWFYGLFNNYLSPKTREEGDFSSSIAAVREKVISVVESIGCRRLAGKLRANVPYRFTGLEVRCISRGFSQITNEIARSLTLAKPFAWADLCYLHFAALQLRKIIAIVSQTSTNEAQIQELKALCRGYWTLKLLVGSGRYKVRNDFTIGVILPYRASALYTRLGLGLGIASMQARESKHEQLKFFLRQTQPQEKWLQTFLYDEVVCHHLPVELHGEEEDSYGGSRQGSYIPEKSAGSCEICLGVTCQICGSAEIRGSIWAALTRSAERGKLSGDVKTYLS